MNLAEMRQRANGAPRGEFASEVLTLIAEVERLQPVVHAAAAWADTELGSEEEYEAEAALTKALETAGEI